MGDIGVCLCCGILPARANSSTLDHSYMCVCKFVFAYVTWTCLCYVTWTKNALISELEEPNVLYYYGERWASVHHARMRIGCSKLNADLCLKLRVLNSPKCRCESPFEDAEHFFFQCPLYNDLRDDLFDSISAVIDVSLHNILFGNPNISVNSNKLIFSAVHLFIVKSERFI